VSRSSLLCAPFCSPVGAQKYGRSTPLARSSNPADASDEPNLGRNADVSAVPLGSDGVSAARSGASYCARGDSAERQFRCGPFGAGRSRACACKRLQRCSLTREIARSARGRRGSVGQRQRTIRPPVQINAGSRSRVDDVEPALQSAFVVPAPDSRWFASEDSNVLARLEGPAKGGREHRVAHQHPHVESCWPASASGETGG
jgi:hypothetical protein